MSTSRSKRFEPIREIAANSALDLSRAAAEAGQRVAELERQHDQLKGYRDEYMRKSVQSATGMDSVRLQNYRAFLDRLGDAVRQHVKKLGVARAEYEARRSVWAAKRIEAESLGRAVERFRQEEQQFAEKREQRDSDEAGQRLVALTRDATEPR
jgi:flagellar export protein FliJ